MAHPQPPQHYMNPIKQEDETESGFRSRLNSTTTTSCSPGSSFSGDSANSPSQRKFSNNSNLNNMDYNFQLPYNHYQQNGHSSQASGHMRGQMGYNGYNLSTFPENMSATISVGENNSFDSEGRPTVTLFEKVQLKLLSGKVNNKFLDSEEYNGMYSGASEVDINGDNGDRWRFNGFNGDAEVKDVEDTVEEMMKDCIK